MSFWSKVMAGRNGIDNICMACLVIVLLCNLLAKILTPVFGVISLFVLTYALFRMFSKRLEKRKKEDDRFMSIINRIRGK